uniref:Uncharacterized protein n=1 Tax=Cyclophora tenuis TaxID=216820 RepID=A0A7S1GL50_CYCTE|mmetsp:Transcript_24796/g.42198  ORF Transcript_24796/g.42198 Transcript_24796/m.42198 type:complete len:241 (+) Transcript_24796:120-842(+)
MSDLSDAEQLTKAIVEWLSHEVVLNKDDFGALQFFQNQWQIKSTRYCLAELQNSIQERLSWKHVEVLLVLMEEESKLDSKLLGLLQLHVLIDELLDIDSNDEDEHEKLGKRAQSFATKRAVQDATKFLQAHRSKETVSLLFKPPYKRDFLREKMSTWIRSYMLRLSRPEIPCVLKREQVKRRHHETRYTKDRVANLKEARARLTAEVEDPLPEARAVAKRARSGGGNLYEPKPSARRSEP